MLYQIVIFITCLFAGLQVQGKSMFPMEKTQYCADKPSTAQQLVGVDRYEAVLRRQLYFYDNHLGFSTLANGNLLRTVDGGKRWIFTKTSASSIFQIHFFDENEGVFITNEGIFYRSLDAGVSWRKENMHFHISELLEGNKAFFFISPTQGYALTYDFDANLDTLLETVDKGKNWKKIKALKRNEDRDDGAVAVRLNQDGNGVYLKSQSAGLVSNNAAKWTRQVKKHSMYYFTNFQNVQNNHWFLANPGDSDIITEAQYLYHSVDDGHRWKTYDLYQYLKKYGHANHYQFINPLSGWLFTEDGYVLNTHNGGKSWHVLNEEKIPNAIEHAYFVSEHNGWLLDGYGQIYVTENGGLNWQQQTVNSTNDLKYIKFIDEKNGYILQDDEFRNGDDDKRGAYNTPQILLKTNNGGKSWEQILIKQFNGIHQLQVLSQNQIVALSPATMASVYNSVAVKQTISISNNAGKSWKIHDLIKDPEKGLSYRSFYFSDAKNGWLIERGSGKMDSVLNTLDGGLTYQKMQEYRGISDIAFDASKSSGIITSYTGFNSMITRDGGKNWIKKGKLDVLRKLDVLNYIDSLEFGYLKSPIWMDEQTIVAKIGSIKNANYVAISKNAGITWEKTQLTFPNYKVGSSIGSPIHNIDVTKNNIWLVGDTGVVYHSANIGKTWELQKTPTRETLRSVSFVDDNTGWAVGNRGVLLKTKNGGKDWQSVPLPNALFMICQ